MGVRDLFEEIYGTDIIDRWKTNAGFYRKILEHSGVRPEEAMTVDDQERCLDWAKRAGFARTFLRSLRDAVARVDRFGFVARGDRFAVGACRPLVAASETRIVRCGPYGLG